RGRGETPARLVRLRSPVRRGCPARPRPRDAISSGEEPAVGPAPPGELRCAREGRGMIVIPAVDLRDGCCVRLREGRAEAETVFSEDPVAMAVQWASLGAERLHIVDLDGAFAGAPRQTALVAKIVAAVRPVPVEAGGGLRDVAAAEAVLEAGVAWAVIGTRAAVDAAVLTDVGRRFGERRRVA